MCRPKDLLKGLPGALGLLLCLVACLPAAGNASEEDKGLFYYVIDRSGSITTYGLTEPIRKAITDHASQLPEETEVRLVFFSRRASESMRWERMTPEAKEDFADYFADNFTPDGPTRLYDTVGEVMEEIRASADDYRFVSVLVFSDGENNWTRTYRSWNDLEPVYRDLVNRHEQSFIYWITLEFEPSEPPPSWVHHEPQAPGTTEIPIPEPAPQAEFTAHPLQLKENEDIHFQYSPVGGRVTEYHWDFGDGTTSNEENPVHQYAQDGVYTVTLRTVGPGGEAEVSKPNLVEVAPVIPLTAAFRFSPERLQVGSAVQLQDTSGGNPEAREWQVNGEVLSHDATPSFMLEQPGELEVSLTVTRGNETDTATQTLSVLPLAPPPGFEIRPAEAEFGKTVVFAADETHADWTHTWTIDGEITLHGAEVEWTSERHGLMQVVHTVEGPGGLARRADRIFIHPPVEILPSPAFTIEPKFFMQGDTVVMRARETQEGWSHEWLLDGEPLGEGAEFRWESDRVGNLLITHRIRIPGTDAVFEDSDEILGRVHELVLVGFSASTLSGVYPLEVQFRDQSSGEGVAYRWDFGDGNFSDQKNPTHIYEKAGDYAVTLAVTNPQGQVTTSTEATVISVQVPMPLWQKVAIGAALALVVWVLIIVPLVLRPLLAPQKGPKLVGIKTYPLYLPARRGWTRFFWPKSSLTVGSTVRSDIRLPADGVVRGNVAVIERSPAASSYTIRPIKKHEIYKIEDHSTLMKSGVEQKAKVTRSRMLRDGDTYEIGGERLTWCQPKKPTARKMQKKKLSQKKRPSPRAGRSLVKVRN